MLFTEAKTPFGQDAHSARFASSEPGGVLALNARCSRVNCQTNHSQAPIECTSDPWCSAPEIKAATYLVEVYVYTDALCTRRARRARADAGFSIDTRAGKFLSPWRNLVRLYLELGMQRRAH